MGNAAGQGARAVVPFNLTRRKESPFIKYLFFLHLKVSSGTFRNKCSNKPDFTWILGDNKKGINIY